MSRLSERRARVGQLQFAGAADFLRSDAALQTACLIVHVQMPNMTGLELHRQLIVSRRPVLTVMISAYPDETTRAPALTAGVMCYLVKPFKRDDLLDCIHITLATRQIGCRSRAALLR